MFDQFVFMTLIGHKHRSASHCEKVEYCGKSSLKTVEFMVHFHTKRLERTLRRMPTRTTSCRRDYPIQQLNKLVRFDEWCFFSLMDNCTSNLGGKLFITIRA